MCLVFGLRDLGQGGGGWVGMGGGYEGKKTLCP